MVYARRKITRDINRFITQTIMTLAPRGSIPPRLAKLKTAQKAVFNLHIKPYSPVLLGRSEHGVCGVTNLKFIKKFFSDEKKVPR